jgi:hypothetical protein
MTEQTRKLLADALRFIEVSQAYRGAMTADQVEKAIVARPTAKLAIGANAHVTTLAEVDLDAIRAALAEPAALSPCEAALAPEHNDDDGARYRFLVACEDFHREPLYPVLDWLRGSRDVSKAELDAAIDAAIAEPAQSSAESALSWRERLNAPPQ